MKPPAHTHTHACPISVALDRLTVTAKHGRGGRGNRWVAHTHGAEENDSKTTIIAVQHYTSRGAKTTQKKGGECQLMVTNCATRKPDRGRTGARDAHSKPVPAGRGVKVSVQPRQQTNGHIAHHPLIASTRFIRAMLFASRVHPSFAANACATAAQALAPTMRMQSVTVRPIPSARRDHYRGFVTEPFVVGMVQIRVRSCE